MEKCLEIRNKEKRKVIGVLSGTSVDAVDVVLLEIKGNSSGSALNIIDFQSFPIEKSLKDFIMSCSFGNVCKVEDICRLNFLIGHLFADAIKSFCAEKNIAMEEIDLIGSHGQTICHLPLSEEHYGFNIKSTLQVGDPSVIANLTGITTVGDFRVADVAAGGGGAPLIPYLDYILFKEAGKNKILLNIGGIANISYLGDETDINNIDAFDTGPGNMLIDALMKELYNKAYDKDGLTAASGSLNKSLLEKISAHDMYYMSEPPKSTGREYYGKEFAEFILKEAEGIEPADIIRTVTEYTAHTIAYNVNKYIKADKDSLHEIVVNGGGASNNFLMNLLRERFPRTEVKKLEQEGINADNKEAVLFAVLANELFNGNRTNVCSVTGAVKNVFLGKICPV